MEYIYGALLLHKLGKEISEDNLKKVIAATGSPVDEAKVKTLVASLHGVNISEELQNANNIAIAQPTQASAPKESKKEEKEEKLAESAAGLASLFG